MKVLVYIMFALFPLFFLSEDEMQESQSQDFGSQSVNEVLHSLGEEYPDHWLGGENAEKAKIGYELVHNGRANLPDGSKSEYISKYYVCTDCHNQVKEDPILNQSDPEARLQYAEENDLKFLQATTFWGMVNRESWYNQDYILKYGSMVEAANKSLAASTQLCAKECSSGRYLEEWELEAILHYYWSIELKLSDLGLIDEELRMIESAVINQNSRSEAVQMMKSKYSLFSPATFNHEPNDKYSGYPGLTGNATSGKMIWDRSCKTCHREYGPSQLILDDSKFTMRKFKRRMFGNSNYSLYIILTHGTYAEPGHLQYMPLYPMERMSNQQIEDLRAFIETASN